MSCPYTDNEGKSFLNASIQELEKNKRGFRKIALHFPPSWFVVTMGTGISSVLLNTLPFNGDWLYWISVVIFALNVVLFVLFLFITVARYVLFPRSLSLMINHPTQSLFIGCFPMGLSTIVNMVALVCVPSWGPKTVTFAWALWWIDAIISAACTLIIPFIMISRHKNSSLKSVTGVWFLPIVPCVVAAASGAVVANILPNHEHAYWTMIISYVLWGMGFPFAMIILVIYFHRLAVFHLPPREMIVSVFLPLGPLGQGAFALMGLANVYKKLDPTVGSIIEPISVVIALIIWGHGLIWLFFAIASVTRSKFPFNMGWWGFTFPLGTYALATTSLAKYLPSRFFKYLGTIISLAEVFLWLFVLLFTVRAVFKGSLPSPCVVQYEKEIYSKVDSSSSDNKQAISTSASMYNSTPVPTTTSRTPTQLPVPNETTPDPALAVDGNDPIASASPTPIFSSESMAKTN